MDPLLLLPLLLLASLPPFLLPISALPTSSSPPSLLQFNANASNLICDIVNCLKGRCVAQSAFPFYRCECDAGWASPFSNPIIPCVLPNCTVHPVCSTGANISTSSVASPPSSSNNSDVCSFTICGNGRCLSSGKGYTCECDSGYENFGNISTGYCLRQCQLGADCRNLNISIGGSNPPAGPSTVNVTAPSQGSRLQGFGKELAMIWVFISVVRWI